MRRALLDMHPCRRLAALEEQATELARSMADVRAAVDAGASASARQSAAAETSLLELSRGLQMVRDKQVLCRAAAVALPLLELPLLPPPLHLQLSQRKPGSRLTSLRPAQSSCSVQIRTLSKVE